MNKKLMGIAGMICLGAILAGCYQVSDAWTGDEVPSLQQTDAAAANQPEFNSEEPKSAAPASTATKAVTIQEEVEQADNNSSLPGIKIPKPVNPLSEDQYTWSQLLPRDAIPPVYKPQFSPANEAPYDDEELVIGVALNGEAKAYAIGPLNSREMVNDTVGGVPILVTW